MGLIGKTKHEMAFAKVHGMHSVPGIAPEIARSFTIPGPDGAGICL